jgi:hypothetical protein
MNIFIKNFENFEYESGKKPHYDLIGRWFRFNYGDVIGVLKITSINNGDVTFDEYTYESEGVSGAYIDDILDGIEFGYMKPLPTDYKFSKYDTLIGRWFGFDYGGSEKGALKIVSIDNGDALFDEHKYNKVPSYSGRTSQPIEDIIEDMELLPVDYKLPKHSITLRR